MPITPLVYSLNSGAMMAPLSLCRPAGVWSLTLINTATWKLSVSTQIGNVSYPSSRPCRIVFVNGSLKSWPGFKSFHAWLFKPLTLTRFVSISRRRLLLMLSPHGLPPLGNAPPTWARKIFTSLAKLPVVIRSVRCISKFAPQAVMVLVMTESYLADEAVPLRNYPPDFSLRPILPRARISTSCVTLRPMAWMA
jgi:hypothetical protein